MADRPLSSPLGLGDVAALHDDHTEKPCGELCPHYVNPRWAAMEAAEREEERRANADMTWRGKYL